MVEIQDLLSHGSRSRSRSGPVPVRIGLGLLAVLLPSPLPADPPVSPPPCDVKLDPLFCVRMTDVRAVFGDPDRFQIELEFLNWTQRDAFGLLIVANSGSTTNEGAAPFISGASIDANGRPIGPTGSCPSGGCPPAGNVAKTNDWTLINLTSSQVCFTSKPFGVQTGTPIPHPSVSFQGVVYDGLLSPNFDGAPQSVCTSVIPQMIPGPNPVLGGSPACITIPDSESIDDGSNVLDGFVLEIDDWDSGEQFSFDWWLIGDDGSLIGSVDPTATMIQGDDYGFGLVNMATLLPGFGSDSAGAAPAPPPLFNFNSVDATKVNTGYDPPDTSDVNGDDPLFFAEDEVGGLDQFPFNPIPAGFPGSGIYFFFEPGATFSAPPLNPMDLPQGSGSNAAVSDFMVTGQGCPFPSGLSPSIEASGAPHVGTSDFVTSLVGGDPLSPLLLLIGFSNQPWIGGFALPLDLTPFGFPGCVLYQCIDVQFSSQTDGSGQASMALTIPNQVNLKGVQMFMQWASVSLGPLGVELAMTPQGSVTIP